MFWLDFVLQISRSCLQIRYCYGKLVGAAVSERRLLSHWPHHHHTSWKHWRGIGQLPLVLFAQHQWQPESDVFCGFRKLRSCSWHSGFPPVCLCGWLVPHQSPSAWLWNVFQCGHGLRWWKCTLSQCSHPGNRMDAGRGFVLVTDGRHHITRSCLGPLGRTLSIRWQFRSKGVSSITCWTQMTEVFTAVVQATFQAIYLATGKNMPSVSV